MTQLDLFDTVSGLPFDAYSYSVRVSNRAKHVHLTMTPEEGLVVVVPKRFSRKRIPEIITKERDWIERTRRRIEKRRESMPRENMNPFPATASFLSVAEDWSIEYRRTDNPRVSASERKKNEILVLSGNATDANQCRIALRRWLGRTAHKHLVPWLERLSGVRGVHFEKTLVKGQRTLWASCSGRSTISINRKLLFLPPHLVRYVFIHELCHVKHMNHSSRFWGHVEKHEPRYKEHEKELRTAWRYVPTWS